MRHFACGKKDGFTLIEILVAVLIMGILSSIALPSYRRAVERSRAAESLTVLRAVYDACERTAMDRRLDTCKQAVQGGKVTFKKLDVLIKGTYGDGGLSLTTNNFKYTLDAAEGKPVLKAEPLAGSLYEGAKITFNGATFDCTPGAMGEAANACNVWGSAGWNVN